MKKYLLSFLIPLLMFSTNAFAVTQGPTDFTGDVGIQGKLNTTGGTNVYLNRDGGNVVIGTPTDTGSGAALQVTGYLGMSAVSLPVPSYPGNLVNDGKSLYFTPTANLDIGVIPTQQMIYLTSSYTLTSQTAAQKLFNVGTGTNGSVSLAANTTYYFECMFSLSSLSATSGTFGFTLGGLPSGATFSYRAEASKTTGNTQGAVTSVFATAASTALTAVGTGTSGNAYVRGIIRVGSTGGTVQPQVSLSVAAAAVVGANSYFKLWPAGTNTNTTVGNVI